MKTQHNRRTFLKTSSALGLASLLPNVGRAANRRVEDTVGHGDFIYAVDRGWGNLDPAKNPVQHCHEMVLDSRGRLLCSSVSAKQNVLVYSKDGKLLDAWQHGLTEPHGLSIAGDGADETFWLTDSADGRVVQLDRDGRMIRELAPPPPDQLGDKRFKPTETTVADNGDIYVADGYGSNLIFRYGADGKLEQVFGGPDHFDCCHGIVVDRRGAEPTLLITSRANNEFQRWTMDGQHLQTYALPGLSVCRPVIDGEETYSAVIVTDSWWSYDGMVAVFDKDMRAVSLPGGEAPPGDQSDFTDTKSDLATFMNPHDVCIDKDKNLYVPQWYSGRTYPLRLRRV